MSVSAEPVRAQDAGAVASRPRGAGEPASFRDPAGRVYRTSSGRILRTVHRLMLPDLLHVRDSGFLARQEAAGAVVASVPVPLEEAAAAGIPLDDAVVEVLEHPRLEVLSLPYEWPYTLLRRAALFHLDLQLDALDADVSLVDASAFNIQFVGVTPVFMDVLSFRRYREGEYWLAHGQFCRHFLTPLLLGAHRGFEYQNYTRGALSGPSEAMTYALLPLSQKVRWRVFKHLALPAHLEKMFAGLLANASDRRAPLPKRSYRAMLVELRGWIASLPEAPLARTTWGGYLDEQPAPALARKLEVVREFCAVHRPRLLLDIGCNAGHAAAAACAAGAERVIGWDMDEGALARACALATRERLPLLPLRVDVVNPSPDQGWDGTEWQSARRRLQPDACIALAVLHHIVVSGGIPLDRAVPWLVGMAPRGLIEFVPPDDPQYRRLTRLRSAPVPGYDTGGFEEALGRCATIVRREPLPGRDRVVYWYG
jgi:ribosomal protein L11 methylase PrmA